MLPIFLQGLFEADRFLVWGFEIGQNAADFSPRAFSEKSISSFGVLQWKQDKMLPIFLQELSQANRFQFCAFRTGQNAADFSPTTFLGKSMFGLGE